MKLIHMLLIMLLVTPFLAAQEKKTDTINIKSSVVCNMCKERVEKGLAYERGIRDVAVDLDTKVVTVMFKPAIISAYDIQIKIARLGYDADTVSADPRAYEKLPACCKKGVPRH